MLKTQYRIAVVGNLEEDPHHLQERVCARLTQIQTILQEQTNGTCQPCLLTVSKETSGVWETIRKRCAIDAIVLPAPQECTADGTQVQDSARRMLVQLSDMADLVLGFWDENPDDSEFLVWEALHRFMEKNVPCIWFSKRDGGEYWAERILFEPFQDSLLQAYLGAMQIDSHWDAPNQNLPWGNRLITWGNRLYQNMLKKNSKPQEKGQVWVDRMMDDGFSMDDAKSDTIRRHLMDAYKAHDREALHLSERYRGSIYWRSILPIAATILLAIGFYGSALSEAISDLIWGKPMVPRFVFILMSLAFFFHALTIAFSHLLARNQIIQSWHSHFLYHRMVAEILRYYLHVVPFGITLPLNRILSKSGFAFGENQPVYVTIWNILHDPKAEQPIYRESDVPAFLDSLENYLCDQLVYHQRNAQRFLHLRSKLRKLETSLVSAGILLVALRGLAQFFIIGINQQLVVLGSGFTLPGYSGSIANMFAMIVPAIAAYYTGKLTLFGFDDSITMSQRMQERLETAIELVRSMKGRNVNYSMVRNLAEQVAILMLGDVASWNQEMTKRRIKGL